MIHGTLHGGGSGATAAPCDTASAHEDEAWLTNRTTVGHVILVLAVLISLLHIWMNIAALAIFAAIFMLHLRYGQEVAMASS